MEGQLSRARNEIVYLRHSLVAMVTLAGLLAGGAVLLAFEVLELRDKLAGVL